MALRSVVLRAVAAQLLLFVAAPALARAPPVCGADGMPIDAIELKEFPIIDRTLSTASNPVPFGSTLAPADWKAEGYVEWREGDACSSAQKFQWSVSSADGSARIAIVSGNSWIVAMPYSTKFRSCPSRDYDSTEAYLLDLLKQSKVKYLKRASRARPDIVSALKTAYGGQAYMGESSLDAVELDIGLGAVAEGGGWTKDGLLVGAVLVTRTSPYIPEYQVSATALPSVWAEFPAGRMNPALVEVFRSSFLGNPNWQWLASKRMSGPKSEPGPDFKVVPFPTRPKSNDGTTPCGRSVDSVSGINGQVWRTDDGRFFFWE